MTAPRGALRRRPPARRLLTARRRLRADLAQLLCALTGLALGLGLPRLTGGPTVDGSRLVEPLFTLGIGVIGVVSIIYSLLFGVVQWSASSYSPRLALFRGDPLVWRTFAFSLGVFVYSVTAGLVSNDAGDVSVLVPVTAILAVLVAFVLIRGLQTRAFLSLQLAHVLSAIAAHGRAVIEDIYPMRLATGAGSADAVASLPPLRNTVFWPGPWGVVQQLELRRLVEAASQADCVVAFRVGVGDVLHDGSALADIHGGEISDEEVRRVVVRGLERSYDQDPMLAVRLMSDIALRALSDAVNDPATAVDAIDAVEGLLLALAVRDLAVGDVHDSAGRTRVHLVLPTWEEFLRSGIEDLLPSAAPWPMVLTRLQRLLTRLLDASPEPAHAPLQQLSREVELTLATRRPQTDVS